VSTPRLVVDADVILDHLRTRGGPSLLRRAAAAVFLYTTVFQAVEIFSEMRTPRERAAAVDAMAAMKILGMNPKNAPHYADLVIRHPRLRDVDLLTAGLCLDGGLPLLTGRPKNFRNIGGLVVVPASRVGAGGDILRHLQG
jgi:predicted nucleic acid-binding protein